MVSPDQDSAEQREQEAALIRRLQSGDMQALGRLFSQHRALVYRTALGITRDECAAEDILQEAFVRLFKYAHSVDSERPLKPWLYRVTVNLSYDWSKERTTQPLDDVLEWLSKLPNVFPAPDRRTESKEEIQMAREAISGLPTAHRAVVVLFYMESLSIEEIAQVLDLPTGTVKSRLHYARERLRDLLTRRRHGATNKIIYEFT